MKLIQISSGRGPAECELAVGKYLLVFLSGHPAAFVKEKHAGSTLIGKYINASFKSVVLELPEDEPVETGTIKWICQSPFRPKHKRKNWFIDVSEIRHENLSANSNIDMYNKTVLKFQTFHCGGKGGQNINKVETGVRLTHIPTGITVTATTARTQHLNKKLALDRLTIILDKQAETKIAGIQENLWLEHERLVRGKAFAVFEGLDFRQI